ncbi:MAG: glutamate synthase (NADPH), homotetrameric [Geobacteraceae bacterium GWC2_53_11]|nr:MAG: glutamate synthase (NADPH), homotetrameric [Geobacteraceae bacterium GWC2_53_11]
MFKVLSNDILAPNLHRMVVQAPRVAAARKAGQFVIVRADQGDERIPLTIGDADPLSGTITLFIQAIGASTRKIVAIPQGGFIRDVAGPLGQPTHIEKRGRVACVGGGVGTAVLYPLVKALAAAGNQVTTIIGGRSSQYIILADELAALSESVRITTEDGSVGRKGFVTAELADLIADPERAPQLVVAVGPVPMMRAVAELTRPHGIETVVSLNPVMIDGTGMCGGCRVVVSGVAKFACVDGPEFDGHLVDFDSLSDRLTTYRNFEELARHAADECRLTCEAPRETLSVKDRLAIPRVHMPEREAEVRSRTFDEVNLGLGYDQAVREAQRCIQCKHRPCVNGCPVGVSIPEFISALAAENLPEAARILQGDNALPAVCGRVCPQETQCEAQCVCGVKGDAVAIGYLERFVADWAMANASELPREQLPPASGKRVAIVGCGPAGLTAAGELARHGHAVTIFEALHDTGGVLRYGIPEFRLPKDIIDTEVARLLDLGVTIECNVIIGKTLTLAQLSDDFNAVFIANGAGLPTMLNIPGENLKGVYSANELLTRVNLMEAGRTPGSATPIIPGRRVAVIGGGNTAMDCVRTVRRLGAEHAMIIYRRSEAEMPARVEEIKHAKEEGVEFVMLTAPLAIIGNKEGWAATLRCQRMELGPPDESGRRKPVPVAGSEHDIAVDVVVNAAGTGANPLLTATAPDLKLNKWGNIAVDDTGVTSIPGVFAGGDIVRGGATVILAMGDGKQVASAINTYLTGAVN